jgi:hypothetical protein
VRPPPSPLFDRLSELVLAFGSRFSLGEHQEAGLVEPDGARLWRVRHGSVPRWATGQRSHRWTRTTPKTRRKEDLSSSAKTGVANWLSGPAAAVLGDGLAALFVANALVSVRSRSGGGRESNPPGDFRPPTDFEGMSDARAAFRPVTSVFIFRRRPGTCKDL